MLPIQFVQKKMKILLVALSGIGAAGFKSMNPECDEFSSINAAACTSSCDEKLANCVIACGEGSDCQRTCFDQHEDCRNGDS